MKHYFFIVLFVSVVSTFLLEINGLVGFCDFATGMAIAEMYSLPLSLGIFYSYLLAFLFFFLYGGLFFLLRKWKSLPATWIITVVELFLLMAYYHGIGKDFNDIWEHTLIPLFCHFLCINFLFSTSIMKMNLVK